MMMESGCYLVEVVVTLLVVETFVNLGNYE